MSFENQSRLHEKETSRLQDKNCLNTGPKVKMMIMIMFWKEGWGTLDTYLETILIDPMMMWYQKSTISRKVISFHSNICSISSSFKFKEKGEWMGIVNFNTSLTRIFETPKTGIMLRKQNLLSTFKNDNQDFNQQH